MSRILPIENNMQLPVNAVNLLFLIAGNISLKAKTKEYSLEKKHYLFYDNPTEITSTSPYFEGFIVSLNREDAALISAQLPQEITLHSPFVIQDSNTIKSMLDNLVKEDLSQKELLANYLNLLLLKINTTSPQEVSKSTGVFEQFTTLIDQNLQNNYCAGTYAELLDIPLKTLIKEVKDAKDVTPCKIITRKVIAKAKSLLLDTNDSSKMIAYQLGFQEPYYFIKYFKNNVGITPTQYRKAY